MAENLRDTAGHALPRQTSAAGNGIIPQPLPLSFSQERFWILDQLPDQSRGYFTAKAFRITGRLNTSALRQSVRDVMARHDICRTTFHMLEDGPRQVVSHPGPLTIPLTEHPNLSETARDVVVEHLLREEDSLPFDLCKGPLIRIRLARFDSQDHLLIISVHHIIWDGRSMEIFLHELSTLYQAYQNGETPTLPPLPLQYGDFTLWQRDRLTSPEGQASFHYWKTQLHNPPSPLSLPTDFPRSATHSLHGERLPCRLSRELTSQLRRLKQQTRCSLFMILLSALQLQLSRYTGNTDIAIGAPVDGRNRQDYEPLIGCFLNTLVLRTTLTDTSTFLQLLLQARKTVLAALTHQDIPFETLLAVLPVERLPGRTPLVQVLLNMHNFSSEELSLTNLETAFVPSPDSKSLFDWTVYFREHQEKLHLEWVYNATLFTAKRMQETAHQFQMLLEQVTADPERPLSHYSLLTPTFKSQLPDPTQPIEEPWQEDVPALISRQAATLPETIAISQGTRTWTYGEVVGQAQHLSHMLSVHNLQPGEVVAIAGCRSFGFVAALLAVLWTGGVVLPMDPRLPAFRQRQMREESKVQHVLWIGQDYPEALTSTSEPDLLRHRIDPDSGRWLDAVSPAAPEVSAEGWMARIQPNDPAYIFFTSGTTGYPKGIVGKHKSLSQFLKWQSQTFKIGPGDRVSQLSALSFDPVLRDVFLPLISGATLCLPADQLLDDPTRIVTWIRQERITVLHTVPTVAHYWLRQHTDDSPLPDLRWIFFSGEPVTDLFVKEWRTFLSESGQLINFYGPTETTFIRCWHVISNPPQPGIQPIGCPLPSTQVFVIRPDHHLCGIGEIGEIVIRTPFSTHGYLNAPVEQARRFRPNPYRNDPSDLWYYTGDRGRFRPDGNLEMVGRMDDQIKIRGVRIEPEEVTHVLRQHPDLQSAVVAGHSAENGENRLIAYAVPKSGASPTDSSVRTFLSSRVPAAMVPSTIVFLDSIPFTANGKIDRRALPLPVLPSTHPASLLPEPGTSTERELMRIWKDVLQLEQVGLHQNFFHLGGHSLSATRMMNSIAQHFDIRLPLRTIFEAPTIAELAQQIESVETGVPSAFPETPSPGLSDREEGYI